MAINLDGTGDFLVSTVTNYGNNTKLSISLWIRSDTSVGMAASDRVFELGGFDRGPGFSLEYQSSTQLRFVFWSGPSTQSTQTFVNIINNTWMHMTITSDTTGNDITYVDGVLHESTSTARAVGSDRFTIGGRNDAPTLNEGEFDIAELCIWNDAILDSSEAASLGNAVSADQIRPDKIVDYWEIVREPLGLFNGDTLTKTGNLAHVDHPRIIEADSPISQFAVAAAPSGLLIPIASYHYRHHLRP